MPFHPDELERLLRDHGSSVWTLVVRLLDDDGHDAADCFQQAFVELAARRDVRDAEALLKRIATARAIDAVRRRMRDRARLSPADETAMAARRELQPQAYSETRELVDDLRAALAELPEQQAAAFVLTQIDDLSQADAAAALGVSANHVGVLLHRARVALRARLESHHPSGETR